MPLLFLFNTTIYAQTYTFTTCGASGGNGPTSCSYSGYSVSISSGTQTWTVPQTSEYRIEVRGAQGGGNGSYPGGFGKILRATYTLTQGHTLSMKVGQAGIEGYHSNWGGNHFGGGGGTGVILNGSTLLLVAGGGGGASQFGGESGKHATSSTSGISSSGAGGMNGSGGGKGYYANDCGWAAGGGGYSSSGYGGTGSDGGNPGTTGLYGGGVSALSGGFGGGGGGCGNVYINGGFGFGGGGSGSHGGGGGGGYSGGGGGQYRYGPGSGASGGGGGGSYLGGAYSNFEDVGFNGGDGQIIITRLLPPDTDNDGVPDSKDDYPNNSAKVVDLPTPLASISGQLRLWLNGASSNAVEIEESNKVRKWYDWSGTQRHATQTSSGYQPTYTTNQINGLSTIVFDGSDDRLILPDSTIPTGKKTFSVFAVVSHSTAAWGFFLGASVGSNGAIWAFSIDSFEHDIAGTFIYSGNGSSPGTAYAVSSVYDATANQMGLYVNGSPALLSNASTNIGADSNFVGHASGFNYFNGKIAELIIIGGSITDTQRLGITTYLAQKWNVVSTPSTPVLTVDAILRSNILASLAWTASNGNGVSISHYEYAIGTSMGVSDVLDWQNAGTNLSVVKSGLQLTPGKKYFISVRAVNRVGMTSDSASQQVGVPGHYIGF